MPESTLREYYNDYITPLAVLEARLRLEINLKYQRVNNWIREVNHDRKQP